MQLVYRFIVSICLAWALINSITAVTAGADVANVPDQPTFYKDIVPIFQRSCQACHHPGTIAPMSLMTYQDARPWAKSIRSKVTTRYMPPWHLDPNVGIREYEEDPSLTDAEIATIAKWVDINAPAGNPADAPKPLSFVNEETWYKNETPDLIITAPMNFVRANLGDWYVTTPPFETGLREDRYIKWIQVLPTDQTVVHHATVNAEQEGGAGETLLGDTPDIQRNRTRTLAGFGGLLTEYVRGNNVDVFNDDAAKVLKAGSKVVFNFHYHGNRDHDVKDISRLGIKFFPKGVRPVHLIVSHPINYLPAVQIPPGEPNVRADAYLSLAAPARIVSFQPHMHYRGKRMLLEAILPDGERRLLTDVPHYTQAWQITYAYKNPPLLPKGTILHVESYFDNSAANKLNPDPTAFVSWGNRTTDEMSNGWTDFYYVSDEEYRRLKTAEAASTPGSR